MARRARAGVALAAVACLLAAIDEARANILNGGFEAGDYVGWTLFEDSGVATNGTWGIAEVGQTISQGDSTFDFFDGIFVVQQSQGLPITYVGTGDFVAYQLQNFRERHRMYQDVTLAADASTLRWDMRYLNLWTNGFNADQQLAVHIRDLSDTILQTLFITTQGVDPPSIPMTTFTADVSAFAGQTVRIDVELNAINFFFPASFDNFVVLPQADLSVVKSDSPDPVSAGAPLTYSLEVSNAGPGTASGVMVFDVLPDGASFHSAASDPSCSQPPGLVGLRAFMDGSQVVPPSGSPATGVAALVLDTVTNELKFAIHVQGVTNAITSATLRFIVGDVLVHTLYSGAPPAFGDSSPISGVIPLTAGEAASLQMPASFYIDVRTGALPGGEIRGNVVITPVTPVMCNLGTIPNGGNIGLDLVADVAADLAAGTTLRNVAIVMSTTDDPDAVLLPVGELRAATAVAETLVEVTADLAITKSDSPDPVVAGNDLTYTVTVENNGPSDAQNVAVADTLPAGVTLVSTSGCAEDPGGVPTCSLGTVFAGASAQYTITVAVGSGTSGSITNTATVSSSTPLVATGDDTVMETTTVNALADLAITKSDSPDPVVAGNDLTYTVTVENNGPSDAQNVEVTDSLPAGVTLVSTSGCAEDPGGVPTCSLGTVFAGAAAQYTITVAVDAATFGMITNQATVTSDATDPNAANDTAAEDTAVVGTASLSVTKEDSQDPVAAGAALSYAVTVSNAGPSAAVNVTVTDGLPIGLTFVSTSGCSNDPNGVPTCDLGSIAAGASAQYTVDVTVDPSADGTITNTVTVSSDTSDPEPGDDTASEDTLVDGGAPTVALVDSAADTGDGEIEECENTKASIRQLIVTFSEEVRDPPGDGGSDDVTNPAHFLLVASGPDQDFATSVCGPVLGDDQAVAIDAVTYDNSTLTATLDVNGGAALGDSLYRLLVCGSIRDLAGNALDGAGNGAGNDDFSRTYRVDHANVFDNARFDCTIDGWIAVSSLPQEIEHSSEDVDGSLVSGSARVTNLSSSTDFSLGQCVAIPPVGYGLGGWIRIDAAPGVLLIVSRTCELFSLAGCTGPSLAVDVNVAFLGDTAGGWQDLASGGTAPTGAASALCSYDLLTPAGASFDAFLDSTSLAFDSLIFSDGFESGNTSAWTLMP